MVKHTATSVVTIERFIIEQEKLHPEATGELSGLPGYPPELAGRVVEGQLYYAGNNSATLAVRGVHVKLTTLWEYESTICRLRRKKCCGRCAQNGSNGVME